MPITKGGGNHGVPCCGHPTDNYRAWYEEAITASNEFGFAGMSAAQVIRYQAGEIEQLRAALAQVSVPAVQGEPVAWVTADTVDGQTVNGKPRRIWWENNEGVGMPIYAAPQPAPDVEGLVEALEAAQKEAVRGINHPRIGAQQAAALGRVSAICDAALAAHRKQGDGHDNR